MNTKKYNHVVEVKKHVKEPWYKKCLNFAIEEDVDFLRGACIRQTNYYLCEEGGKIYLVDSDENKNEISWIDLTSFVEIEVGDSVYRKYRSLK